ncbi:hypothetical protein [Spiroplasma endosymbiont of Nebria brevicollis]|uniref:hypothetical protein n=1 Tax=Spiroplasma endosymbiont of Nebria brevicollis TaxID=3066284 RepID=UPI00313E1230
MVSSNEYVNKFKVSYDIFYNFFNLKELVPKNKNTFIVPTFKESDSFSFLSSDIISDYFWNENWSVLKYLFYNKPYHFVKELDYRLKYKASDESIENFNKKENNNSFENFNELNNEFKKMMNSNKDQYNIDWDNILKKLFPNDLIFQKKNKGKIISFL